jgi:2-isopropylmalate synthase
VEHGLELPRDLQIEFSRIVRRYSGAEEGELTPSEIRTIFDREYMIRKPTVALLIRCAAGCGIRWLGVVSFRLCRQELIRRPKSGAAVSCADKLRAMGRAVCVLETHWAQIPGSRQVAVYVRCEAGAPVWGVGIGRDVVAASRRAVLSAVSRSQPITQCPLLRPRNAVGGI